MTELSDQDALNPDETWFVTFVALTASLSLYEVDGDSCSDGLIELYSIH